MAYYSPSQFPRKIHFSKIEIRDLLLAWGAITLAFAISLSISGYGSIAYINWLDFPKYLLISVFAVGTGFLLHELGHKFVANRFGTWAEFRAWPSGLIMALIFALMIGAVFAAPGAVYISGNVTEEQNGKISLAGPSVNIIFAAIFLPLALITNSLLGDIFSVIYIINAFLGMFNLLPIMPLDGAKILRWSKSVYITSLVIVIGLLVPYFLL